MPKTKIVDFETGGLKMAIVMLLKAMAARESKAMSGVIKHGGDSWKISVKKLRRTNVN